MASQFSRSPHFARLFIFLLLSFFSFSSSSSLFFIFNSVIIARVIKYIINKKADKKRMNETNERLVFIQNRWSGKERLNGGEYLTMPVYNCSRCWWLLTWEAPGSMNVVIEHGSVSLKRSNNKASHSGRGGRKSIYRFSVFWRWRDFVWSILMEVLLLRWFHESWLNPAESILKLYSSMNLTEQETGGTPLFLPDTSINFSSTPIELLLRQ